MDFTLKTYRQLLQSLQSKGYSFLTFEDFVETKQPSMVVVLRHDVDRFPANALKMALIETSFGIRASYFFRSVPNVWNENIMHKIVEIGHELAYHYEDLTIAKGNDNTAIEHFKYQLSRFRKIYPSKTICMHGSPTSKFDNRKIWGKYNYGDYGIIAEPYFDVDYHKVFYITDTGRAWNNDSSNVRDTVSSGFNIKIKSTKALIKLIEEGQLPDQVIINTHPHRWFDPGIGWCQELVFQNLKNIIKKYFLK